MTATPTIPSRTSRAPSCSPTENPPGRWERMTVANPRRTGSPVAPRPCAAPRRPPGSPGSAGAASLSPGFDVGVVGLGEAALGGLDLLEAGVGLELEHVERAHLVAAAAAVAGAAPAIMIGLAEGVGVALLVGSRARRRPRRSALRNNSSCDCIRRRGARRNTSARGCWAIWARAGRRAPRSRGGRNGAPARRRARRRRRASAEIPSRSIVSALAIDIAS